MKSSHSHRPRSISYNMTAMIDMAFLLITFFVMSIRMGQAGEEEITLPKADKAQEVTDERVELIIVNVTEDGYYAVGGVRQTAAQLRIHFETRKDESTREVEVVIRGDKRTAFEAVQRAMRASAEAGIKKVGLAALQLDEIAAAGEQ